MRSVGFAQCSEVCIPFENSINLPKKKQMKKLGNIHKCQYYQKEDKTSKRNTVLFQKVGETEIFIFLMNSQKSRWVFKILTIKIMNNFHPMFNGTSCISMSTNQASKQALILEGAIKEFRGFKATLLKKCQIEKKQTFNLANRPNSLYIF